MKNQLLLIIFLFIGNSIAAQGLSGNRFTVFYNADYHGSTLSWSSAIANSRSDVFGYYNFKDDKKKSVLKSTINFRHSLNLNYTFNRLLSAGLQFGLSRDSYGAGILFAENFPIEFTANYKYFSTEAEVKFFKVARKGALAPLGGYLALRAGISSVKTNIKIAESQFPGTEERPTEINDFNAFSLAMVLGKQFILYKNVMMNVGFECKYNFITQDIGSTANVFDLSRESAKTRVFWNDILRLRVGVGLAPL